MQDEQFTLSQARPTIEIHLPDGRLLSGPRNATIGSFLKLIEDPDDPFMGAIVNGDLRELNTPISLDAVVSPVTLSSSDGMHIYRRSLVFLLEAAFEDLYHEASLIVDHSVSSGGYYCRIENHPPLTAEELATLEQHMRELVAQDMPMRRREVPLAQATAYFASKGYQDKVRLLAHRRKDYLALYRLGDHMDYHHGYMVPSTGLLRWFGLYLTGEGFTLRFPRRDKPTQLEPMPDYPRLLDTFRLYGSWLDRLGIANLGALNDAIESNRASEIVLVSEALHERYIAEVATQIAAHRDQLRVILIAGPSSSGKTTFSKRLAVQLLAQGLSPYPVEMDNYFVNRDETPKDEKGEFDFEAFDTLDHKQLEIDLAALVAGKRVQLPRYNFFTGMSERGESVQLQPGQILILEGIHGMNPRLLPNMPPEQVFRIYVSALTQLNLDRHNRISTTDTRLIRRIVRDARERGYSARQTIARWESVRRGERRHIFPYQENANIMFNSALAYELAALKALAEPLLRQVPHGVHEFIEAKRLLALLEWALPLDTDLIPDNSIMREFIGGSILKNFKLWHNNVLPE